MGKFVIINLIVGEEERGLGWSHKSQLNNKVTVNLIVIVKVHIPLLFSFSYVYFLTHEFLIHSKKYMCLIKVGPCVRFLFKMAPLVYQEFSYHF